MVDESLWVACGSEVHVVDIDSLNLTVSLHFIIILMFVYDSEIISAIDYSLTVILVRNGNGVCSPSDMLHIFIFIFL